MMETNRTQLQQIVSHLARTTPGDGGQVSGSSAVSEVNEFLEEVNRLAEAARDSRWLGLLVQETDVLKRGMPAVKESKRVIRRNWGRAVLVGAGIAAAFLAGALVERALVTGPSRRALVTGPSRLTEQPFVVLPARLVPQPAQHLGGPQEEIQLDAQGVFRLPQNFRIVIQSERRGVATVILLTSNRREVWPHPNQEAIEVDSSQPRYYGPFRSPEDKATVLAIVTERSATDTIRQLMASGAAEPVSADELIARIQTALQKEGHRWVVLNQIVVERAERE
jgi:hypothetical protein